MKKIGFKSLIVHGRRKKWDYLLLIMKINFLLAFICVFHASASVFSQNNLLDIKLKNATVREILKEIESKTDYRFFYNDEFAFLDKRIDVNISQKRVEETLEQIFTHSNITYKVMPDNVVVIYPSQKQSREITGVVIDLVTGEPIPGANILIQGTVTGTTSDVNGRYRLNVPGPDAVLIFSYVGYLTEQITVGNQLVIDVALSPDIKELQDIVVVGYGTQQKYMVVSSLTTIEPQKLQMGTNRSISNNLAGQLAGIIAVQRSGEPGYDNSTFWIRGISTFADAKYPLVLIDGIERSLNNIDPAEIESFSILKDASATAVYGVRGANGVILINTKRGMVGKPTVNVRFEQGFTQPVKTPDFLGAADFLEVFNSIAEENGEAPLYDQEYIDNIRNQTDPDLYPDVNWLDAITKDHASNSRLNLTVSGGTELLRYALVGSYYNEQGIIDRDYDQEWNSSMKLNRYNVRSNIDLNVTPSTLFRVNIGGYLQDDIRPPQSIDYLFSMAFETPPYVHPTRYSSGEIPVTPERTNPWALATQTGYSRRSYSKIESLFSVEQDMNFLAQGLKAKINFSFDRYSGTFVDRKKSPDYYIPATTRNEDGSLDLSIYRYGQEFLGYETGAEWGDKSVYLEGNLSYTRYLGKHFIDALFLYNQRHYDNGSPLPFRNQGIAGRLSYSYDYRYIAEFNFGYNGSENFAKGHRMGFFPSVAAGWLMSEEEFMRPLKNTFSKVKLRASYGLVGNDQLGIRFAYIPTIEETDGYRWGVNNDYHRAGRREGFPGVTDLTWETVAKTNIGLELGLWNSVDFQVDVFKEQRRDIFMQRRTVPGSSGFIQTPWANYGKVDNQGIDMSLDVNKKLSRDLSISARGTFTYAVNEIIEQDEPSAVVGTYRSSTGKPVGQIFGLIAEGLFTEEDFADVENGVLKEGLPTQDFGPVRPGDIKYRDLNDDGMITDLDMTAIGGTYDPQIVYGFGVNAFFKNIDFGFFLQGNAKTYRLIRGLAFIPGSGGTGLGNIYSNVNDRWTVDNPSQDVFWPRLTAGNNENNNRPSTWWLRDMSMLRVKSIELGYSFPVGLIGKAGMKSARLFARGDNLFTFSGFDLWDPELGTDNGFRYPIMKSVSIGLDVNF